VLYQNHKSQLFIASFTLFGCLLFGSELSAQDQGKLENYVTSNTGGRESSGYLVIQVDRSIIVVGSSSAPEPGRSLNVLKYAPDFSLDGTFGIGGVVRIPGNSIGQASDVAVQADGKIVVLGSHGIARLDPFGALDPSFRGDGIASSGGDKLAIQGDGKIVVVCCGVNSGLWRLRRLHPNGNPDLTFGVAGLVELTEEDFQQPDPTAMDLAIQPDGKIIVVGGSRGADTRGTVVLAARFNADGTLDEPFGGGDFDGIVVVSPFQSWGALARSVRSIALQPDGKILIGGSIESRSDCFAYDFMVARLFEYGDLDFNFGTNGLASVGFADCADHSFVYDLAVQDDNRIVAVGTTFFDCETAYGDSCPKVSIARLMPDGELDKTRLSPELIIGFAGNGKTVTDFGANSRAWGAAVRFDRILVSGDVGEFPGPIAGDLLLARYVASGELYVGVIRQYITSVACPDDVSASNDPNQCGASIVFAPPLPGDPGTVTCAPASGDFFDVGNTEVTCRSVVGDGTQNQQRTASCSLNVAVSDNETPSISCPEVSVFTDLGQCSAVTDLMLSSDDNCSGLRDPIASPPDGSIFGLGTTPYTASVTDASGHAAICASTVTVIDDTAPEIQCNTDGVDVRPGVPVSFQATATDSCSVASVAVASYDCWAFNPAGNRVDRTKKCSVSVSGADVNIVEPSGVGTIIGWEVVAEDGSGNTQTASCHVVSQNPSSL
jgi:uncharacterized delta-60 repeat protein